MIDSILVSSTAVHTYDFHMFIAIIHHFEALFDNPSWLVSSVGRTLHRYRRGHGFKSRTRLNFFQVLFSTTRFGSVLSCEDLLHSIFHIVVALRDYNSSLIFPSLNNI